MDKYPTPFFTNGLEGIKTDQRLDVSFHTQIKFLQPLLVTLSLQDTWLHCQNAVGTILRQKRSRRIARRQRRGWPWGCLASSPPQCYLHCSPEFVSSKPIKKKMLHSRTSETERSAGEKKRRQKRRHQRSREGKQLGCSSWAAHLNHRGLPVPVGSGIQNPNAAIPDAAQSSKCNGTFS